MSRVRQLFSRGAPSERAAGPSIDSKVDAPEQILGVMDTYRVPARGRPDASAEVFVVEEDGVGRYLVRSPAVSDQERRALEILRSNLLDSIPPGAVGDPGEVVADYVWKTAEGAGLTEVVERSHDKLLYYLMRDFSGFWEIDPLMNDDNLEEISVCRYEKPVRVLHRNFSEYMFIVG
jgi:hypothetical protein